MNNQKTATLHLTPQKGHTNSCAWTTLSNTSISPSTFLEITVAPWTLNSIDFPLVPILTNPILSYEERSRYWSRGHLIYHTAWNPEKKYLTKGVIQYHFLHLSAELNQAFFLAKSEWWQLSDRWDLWQKFSLSLSLLSSPLASFSTWIDFQAPGYWHRDMRTVPFKCTRNPTHGTVSKQLPLTIEHYMKARAKVLSIHSKLKMHRRNRGTPCVVRLTFVQTRRPKLLESKCWASAKFSHHYIKSIERHTKTLLLCVCLGDLGIAKMLLSGY